MINHIQTIIAHDRSYPHHDHPLYIWTMFTYDKSYLDHDYSDDIIL